MQIEKDETVVASTTLQIQAQPDRLSIALRGIGIIGLAPSLTMAISQNASTTIVVILSAVIAALAGVDVTRLVKKLIAPFNSTTR